jgi:cytidylate kinase
VSDTLVITLDGPAGVGKTTLAKRVAGELRVAYLDTGAMFRAAAMHLGEGAAELPQDEFAALLADIDFSLAGSGADSKVVMNGRVLGDEIRTEQVGMLASNVAVIPAVRRALMEAQQAIGLSQSLVAEGRDMGTVVFPGATAKFFLDAAPEVRAERRVKQLRDMGNQADYEQVLANVIARDAQDRGRAVAPLAPAEDAHVIDTGVLDVNGVFRAIMDKVEAKR